MSVAITHKVKRMLMRLAVCPDCGEPAKLIVDPKGMIGWSCGRCLKDREALAALDGLVNRGVVTAEQAEDAKRRLAEGGAK